MNSINTNMSALAAQQSMKAQNEALDQAMERLSQVSELTQLLTMLLVLQLLQKWKLKLEV